MATVSMLAALVGLAGLVAPVPTPAVPPDVSLGAGWTVAQVHAALGQPAQARATGDAPGSAGASSAETAVVPEAPALASAPPRVHRPKLRPYAHHTAMDQRKREARRLRAIQVSAALAAQAAMLVYGITQTRAAAREAEAIRNESARPRSQYNPFYPR